MASRCQGKRQPIMRIERECLLKQSQRFGIPLSRYWMEHCERAQIKVVGGEVSRGARAGAPHLSGLQCWFDHPGHARCYPVLKLKHVFQRAVEPVGPEMGAGMRTDQLRRNADPLARFAD